MNLNILSLKQFRDLFVSLPIPQPTSIRCVLARTYYALSNGVPHNSALESMFNMSVTAHILGGDPIGAYIDNGVIDSHHKVFGYPGLYVMDGSAIPANVGVNPSLTITALTERAMSLFPSKS